MVEKTKNQIKQILDSHDIKITTGNLMESPYELDLETYSPEGEDVIITIEYDGTGDGFVTAFAKYAENFDAEEHAEAYIRQRGTNGVPDSIRTLLDDAEWIKNMLMETADELENNSTNPCGNNDADKKTYTVRKLVELFKTNRIAAEKNPHIASEIKPLFNKNGTFNIHNWNSRQDIIRERLYEEDILYCENTLVIQEYECLDILACIHCANDMWYIQIGIMDTDCDDSYIIRWYKQRGCTEMISKNGKPITISEYTDLLNTLDQNGFFDAQNWRLK